jgi:hypothetical protein
MRPLHILILAFALYGCTTGPFSAKRDLDASSPQQGTVVTCSGGYKTWQDCSKAAAQLCPGGYEILERDENINMQARSLRISCK